MSRSNNSREVEFNPVSDDFCDKLRRSVAKPHGSKTFEGFSISTFRNKANQGGIVFRRHGVGSEDLLTEVDRTGANHILKLLKEHGMEAITPKGL